MKFIHHSIFNNQNFMNNSIRLIIALGFVVLATTSCKTKQKIATIPSGANVEATAPKPVSSTPVAEQVEAAAPVVYEKEVTRNESFTLVDGQNADALKYKYHVVVGSFSKQENAKGLQSTLNAEGNKSIIVVNEKGMYRLLIASFNDYNQAHVRIKEISNRFPDAWVLVQK